MTANLAGINPRSFLHRQKDGQPSKASNTRDMRKQQTRLSENMELLELFHYRDPSKKLSNALSSKDDRDVLHILDMISVCFATGQEGDVIATMVAIQEKAQKVCFFLANNRSGAPSTQEKDAILQFRTMLAGAKTYKDLIPFVAGYSRQNVTKRVWKLRTGFNNVLSSQNMMTAIGAIDSKNVFLSLLQECNQLVRPTPKHDSDYRLLQTPTSCREFVRLIETARNLEKREEWNRLCDEIEQRFSERSKAGRLVEYARTLQRRLCKITQYRALGNLIQFVNAHKSYDFEWVPDLFRSKSSGEMTIKAQSLERIARSRVDELLSQQKAQRHTEYDAFVVKAKKKAQDDPGKWPSEFVTNIHCEIRVIRYCAEMIEKKTFTPRELIIGTSKRCCLFCDEWINHFNKITGSKFMTGGSHGKAYRRAALTGVEDKDWTETDENLIKGIEKHVINCIRLNIQTHRPKLLAPSDEYASSMEDCLDFTDKDYRIGYTASYTPGG
ncbi:hypothetical protein C0993_012819 [Termitomyces sp. T159_Od127]|nr:hypothetical protein C0993_012819 [Termitomyces sp. T159_Od127]